jgi:Flp pilus assembly pilin Flp
MSTACVSDDPPPAPRQSRSSRRAPASAGQNLVEYAIVVAVIAVVSVVAINFLRDSFKTLYIAHQSPLNQPIAALAMTATPDESLSTATPTPTRTPLTATWTPIPTLTPTPTPLATSTPTTVPPTPTPEPVAEEPSLPSCDNYPAAWRWLYRALGVCE